jgi:hypothetical protein
MYHRHEPLELISKLGHNSGEHVFQNSRKYSTVRGVGEGVEGGQASRSSGDKRAMDKHVRRI